MEKFGNLNKLKLRDYWPNEAQDFTPWLADNIESLGKALGMELELLEQEASVGSFSLDILAKDLSNNQIVIIENQLTQTDHDHLGKLLTYASGFNASMVIWIAKEIRDEHKQALNWLNDRSDDETGFFGVEIDVFQIDSSSPAFVFNPIVYPSEWKKSKTKRKQSLTPRGEAYLRYFQSLIDILREQHRFTGAKKAQPQSWYSFASGLSGLTYTACFTRNNARVELYIDTGDKNKNEDFFDWLKKDEDNITTSFNKSIHWDRLDNKKASRVYVENDGSVTDNNDALDDLKNWQIENLLLFKKILGPYIKRYKSK